MGFFPKKHVRSANSIYSHGSDEMESQTELGSQAYSMVLTGAAFIHLNYLKMLNSTGVVPQAVHKLIDEMHNCEDLAVNVLVGLPGEGGHGPVSRPVRETNQVHQPGERNRSVPSFSPLAISVVLEKS